MGTTNHGWDFWQAGQTQPDQAQNDNLKDIDWKLGLKVLSRTTDAQPGSPSAGDAYIMTASATGAAWVTYAENDVAVYDGTTWSKITPGAAIQAFVDDETKQLTWDNGGSEWVVMTGSLTQYVGQNLQTGVAYELVLTDAGKIIDMSNAAANVLTIPANSAVAFPINTRIDIIQYGAGETSIAITTDTLRGDVKCRGQYQAVSLWKRTSTEWVIWGGKA